MNSVFIGHAGPPNQPSPVDLPVDSQYTYTTDVESQHDWQAAYQAARLSASVYVSLQLSVITHCPPHVKKKNSLQPMIGKNHTANESGEGEGRLNVPGSKVPQTAQSAAVLCFPICADTSSSYISVLCRLLSEISNGGVWFILPPGPGSQSETKWPQMAECSQTDTACRYGILRHISALPTSSLHEALMEKGDFFKTQTEWMSRKIFAYFCTVSNKGVLLHR